MAWTDMALVYFISIFSVMTLTEGLNCQNDYIQYGSTDKCVKAYTAMMTRSDANDACANDGGVLASILDATEQAFIETFIGSVIIYWIGLNDIVSEGDYRWEDGCPYSWNNLGLIQGCHSPPILGGYGADACDCIKINDGIIAYNWFHARCFLEYAYICQYTPPPEPPTSVTASKGAQTDELTIDVTEGTGSATEFKVQIQEAAVLGAWGNIGPELNLAVTSPATYSISLTLTSGNVYRASVISSSIAGDSGPTLSNDVNIAPSVPASVTIVITSTIDEVGVSISAGEGTVTQFSIQMQESSVVGVWGSIGAQILKDELAGPNFVVNVALSPGNSFRAVVTSLAVGGESGQLISDDVGIPPIAPLSVSVAMGANTNQIDVTALEGTGTVNQLSIQIQESINNVTWVNEGGVSLHDVTPGQDYVATTSLTPGRNYRVSVTSISVGGESAPTVSNGLGIQPSVPTSVLVLTTESNNELNMTIEKGVGTVAQFAIQVQESSVPGVWGNVGPAILKDDSSGPNYVINVTLTAGNRYKTVVTSLAATGESESRDSNEINITPMTPSSVNITTSANTNQIYAIVQVGAGTVNQLSIQIQESVLNSAWINMGDVSLHDVTSGQNYVANTSLTPGRSYRVSVTSISVGGESAPIVSNGLGIQPSVPTSVLVQTTEINTDLNVTIEKGFGTVTQFAIQMQESRALGVWVNVGPAILKDDSSGPSYVINVTLSAGNRYKTVVTSLTATGESGSQESNDINITPLAPVSVNITLALPSNQIAVSIQAGEGTVDQFRIQILEAILDDTWIDLGAASSYDVTLGPDYVVTVPLSPGRRYIANVTSVSIGGEGEPTTSNSVGIEPTSPVSVNISANLTSNELNVVIQDGMGTVLQYSIQVQEAILNETWDDLGVSLLCDVTSGPNYVVPSSFTPGRSYKVTMTSVSLSGESEPIISNKINISPSVPSFVSVSASPSNNEIKVTVVKGPGNATQFTIKMQESRVLGVWENMGPEILKDEPLGPHYAVNVSLLPGNCYMAVVTSLTAAGESEPINSNEITIRGRYFDDPGSHFRGPIGLVRLNVGDATLYNVTSGPSYIVSALQTPGRSYRAMVTSLSVGGQSKATTSSIVTIPMPKAKYSGRFYKGKLVSGELTRFQRLDVLRFESRLRCGSVCGRLEHCAAFSFSSAGGDNCILWGDSEDSINNSDVQTWSLFIKDEL